MELTAKSVKFRHLAKTKLRSRGAVSMILSTAASVKRAQLVRSSIRRCSRLRLYGRLVKAASEMSSQLASLSSRKVLPFVRSEDTGTFPIFLHWWRSISRRLGQLRANVEIEESSS
jgi:hypothetical protein